MLEGRYSELLYEPARPVLKVAVYVLLGVDNIRQSEKEGGGSEESNPTGA